MIRPRWIKVLRDLLSNKTRTLMVTVSIAVGVVAVGTTLAIQDILSREMARNWKAYLPSSGQIHVQGIEQDFVNAIRHMPEIADAEGRSSVLARARPNTKADFKYLEVQAIYDFKAIHLNRITRADVIDGNWPPPRRELVLSTNSLDFLGVHIGDTLNVQMPNNKVFQMQVAGTVKSTDETGGPFMESALGFVTYDTWEWLDQSHTFDTLLFRVADQPSDRQHIQHVADLIKERIKRDGRPVVGIEIPQIPDQHPAGQTALGVITLMVALGIASLVASGFLVTNTIQAVLGQHVRQIGVMKAIGARANQLIGMYVMMSLAFGILALLIAMPLSLILTQASVQLLGQTLLNLDIESFRPVNNVFIGQVCTGLITPVLAAIGPVLKGTRRTIREALSDYGLVSDSIPIQHRPRRKPITTHLISTLPRPLLVSLKNALRRRERLTLTLLSLVIGGGIFIGVMSAQAGLNRTLDAALAYWNYDLDATLNQSYPAEQLEREAAAVSGIERVECWGFASARRQLDPQTEGTPFTLIAPPAETTMLKPILRRGRWLQSTDEDAVVVNTDLLANEKDVSLGSTIPVRLNDNQRVSLRIVGVVQGVLTGPVAYMNRRDFTKATQSGNKYTYVVMSTTTRNTNEQTQISKAVEERFKRMNIQVSGTSLTSAARVAINAQFSIIINLLLLMAILLAVVGGFGLAGTMGLNVLERTREIGVMRAIGATGGILRFIVLVEGVVIGILSWGIGVILAVPFSIVITSLLGAALQFSVFYTPSVLGALLWLLIVIVIAAVASLLPAWHASRQTVRETLAY